MDCIVFNSDYISFNFTRVMPSLSDIRAEIFTNDEAKRIVIVLSAEIRDAEGYRALAYETVEEIFPDWERDCRIRFLAIEVWADRIFIDVDINHHDYDFGTAHRAKVLPVYLLRPARKMPGWTFVRWRREDESVAKKLAYLHNAHGYNAAVPLLENHNSRIVHDNPREFPL
ncbi:hypothetical protein ACP6JE_006643 [Aspergillus fumigatus]